MTRHERLAALLILAAALWLVIAAAFAAGFATGTALAASRPAQLAAPPSGDGQTTERLVPLPLPDVVGQGEGPDDHPGTSPTGPPGRITRVPTVGQPSAPARAALPPATVDVPSAVAGIATWFDSPGGVSAAGPALRAALGPGWRGQSVRVCAASGCVTTVLGDWMRADRLIDLHAPLFAALAPLSVGILRVTVTPVPAPPETSTP